MPLSISHCGGQFYFWRKDYIIDKHHAFLAAGYIAHLGGALF